MKLYGRCITHGRVGQNAGGGSVRTKEDGNRLYAGKNEVIPVQRLVHISN